MDFQDFLEMGSITVNTKWLGTTTSLKKVSGNIEIQGRKQNTSFPKGIVIKWFVIYSKTSGSNRWELVSRLQQQHQATFNSVLWSSAIQSTVAWRVWPHSFCKVACSWHLVVNSFIVKMSCNHELTSEWVQCSRKNASYILLHNNLQ